MTEASEVEFGFEVSVALVMKFVMAAIGLAGTILFANLLGPSTLGSYYLLLSVVFTGNTLTTGLAGSCLKRFSETDMPKDEIIGVQVLGSALITGAIAVLAVAFRSRLTEYVGLEAAPWALILLVVTFAVFLSGDAIHAATGRIGLNTTIDFLRSVLTLPLQVAFVMLGMGAIGLAVGLGTATLLTGGLLFYIVGIYPTFPTASSVRSVYRYARFSVPTQVAGLANRRLDVLLIGAVLTPAVVGYYEVALRLVLPAAFAAEILGQGLTPRVSNLHSKGEAERIVEDVKNSMSFGPILSIPIFFGAVAMPEALVVTAFSPEFAEAAELIPGLALAFVFRSTTAPLQSTIGGLDRPDLSFRINLWAFVLKLVVGYALLTLLGPIGIVIAAIVAEVGQLIAAEAYCAREIGTVVPHPPLVGAQLLAGAIMFLVVSGLQARFPVSSWVVLAAIVLAGAGVYTVLLVLLSKQVRVTVRSVLAVAWHRYGTGY